MAHIVDGTPTNRPTVPCPIITDAERERNRATAGQQLACEIAALDLARKGYYVHPLVPGDKIPLAEHGSNDATRDEATIRAWWQRWPNANVGISLDKTGLVDIAPDSPEWAARFKANGLPRTTLYTSGGGPGCWHALYRLPRGGPVARINVSKQYDLMSQGNAVAPGSIHPSGRTYTAVTPILPVEDLPLAPAWVIELLAEKQTRSGSAPDASAEWEQIPNGVILAQSRRFLALCKANDQLRAVCAGEPVVLTTKSGGKDGSTSIQRSVFVNQLLRAKYPHAEIRALALHFSGVLESNPRHFAQDIDRLLFKYTPIGYAPQPTGAITSAPTPPRGGRHYEITASDMLDRYHEHADCGPAGIILDWTIDDAAQRLGVSTGTIKRREAELTEAGHIRREYGHVILARGAIGSQPIETRQTAPIATPVPLPAADPLPIGSQSVAGHPIAENPHKIPVCVEQAHVERTHVLTAAPTPPCEPAAAEVRPGGVALGGCVLSAPAGALLAPGSAGYSVDCVQYTSGRVVWRVWDDALDQVIGEYTTEAAALAAIGVEQRGAWRTLVPDFDDSAQPELATFDGLGVPVPVAEPAPVLVLVEIEPLVQAPPLSNEPTYSDFIWRYHASKPHSTRKNGQAYTQSQRDRFRRDMQRYLVEVSPEEAALRWAALQQPQARPAVRVGAGARAAPPSQARRPAGRLPALAGQQASLFGGAL